MSKTNLNRSQSQLWWHFECSVNITGPFRLTEMCLRFLCLSPKRWTRHSLTTCFALSAFCSGLWSGRCICTKFKCGKGGADTRQLWNCRSAVSDQRKRLSGAVLVKNWTSFWEETREPFAAGRPGQFWGCKTSGDTQRGHLGVNCSHLQRCSSRGLVSGRRVETLKLQAKLSVDAVFWDEHLQFPWADLFIYLFILLPRSKADEIRQNEIECWIDFGIAQLCCHHLSYIVARQHPCSLKAPCLGKLWACWLQTGWDCCRLLPSCKTVRLCEGNATGGGGRWKRQTCTFARLVFVLSDEPGATCQTGTLRSLNA